MSEMKLYGQGEMHLRVTTERLADRFGVTIHTQKPTVAYRETIRDAVTVRGRHKKQSGGHGQFGDVVVEVAPRGPRRGLRIRRAGAWRIGAAGNISLRSKRAQRTRWRGGRSVFPWSTFRSR